MKLTSEQISKLFIFTRQHFVEYFDVQSELVDHLANAIETEWQENPKISFEEALNKEFKKFGVFRFMDVVEQKQKQLRRKYHSIIWLHFKEFFGVPKIVVTALSVFAMYIFLAQVAYPKEIVMSFYVVFLVIVFYQLIKNKNQQEKDSQKWLFKGIIFNYGSTIGIFILLFQILNFSINRIEFFLGTNLFLLFMAIILVLLFVFGYIILFLIPSKADEYLGKTYPEFNL
ncbi:MAG: hypothetical protein ABI554_14655 [Flavobacterium sp.]